MRPASEFDPTYGDAVAADRDRLVAIRDALAELDAATDPKLAALVELLESSPAQKIAVFSTFGATIRYLDEHLPARVGGRERVAVIGSESTPDQRLAALGRFAPRTRRTPRLRASRRRGRPPALDGRPLRGPEPPAGAGGHLLRHAVEPAARCPAQRPRDPAALRSRRGLPLDDASQARGSSSGCSDWRRGSKPRSRRRAACTGWRPRSSRAWRPTCATTPTRLADGDAELLDESEETSGAFIGEELRRLIDRALAEGEVERVLRLPWGIGACFRQTPGGRSQGAPGVFFATRTPAMPDAPDGYRYWRFVELPGQELVSTDLQILRRIDPHGGEAVEFEGVDLEAAWEAAAERHCCRRTTSVLISGPSRSRSVPSSDGRLRCFATRPSRCRPARTWLTRRSP